MKVFKNMDNKAKVPQRMALRHFKFIP